MTSQVCLAPACECSLDTNGLLMAACKVQHLGDIRANILHPRNVSSLVLHVVAGFTVPSNGLQMFTNLINLTLENNSISAIAPHAFKGLDNLQSLNLRHNNISLWEGNISRDLPSLEILELDGNPVWKPTNNVLELGSLKEIRGLAWSEACGAGCNLVKNLTDPKIAQYAKGHFDQYVVWHCRGFEFTVSETTRTFARYNFLPTCFDTNIKCYSSEVVKVPRHRCWDTDNKFLYVEYFIGIAVIILNFNVVVITSTTPLLRNNIAMLLVSNLAISDCVIGVYSICVTAARQSASYQVYVTFLDRLCSVLGFMWVLGQFETIQTSLLLTMERYATIVFAMRPRFKPTQRVALTAAGISWCIAICGAILPLAGIGSYVTNTYCVPIQPSQSVPSTYAYSVGVALYGILLYAITIPLYIHIFLFVSKTSHQAGVKRDGKIARRIALLVVSNMVFFITPIIICLLWLLTDIFKKDISVEGRNVLVGVFPTFCFTFNSFLNPLLYAYRNSRFKIVLKQKMRRVFQKNVVMDISLRSTSKAT
ncbi:predicted protein [Nematostella vectensis]|uniref:G-protein coupled receptors family 1 profile domain-containing protein n=2 Tax=Nematostella vectensis TaxID=45351 RepID=A7RJD4_NEMVE|nr:predicted protein [Nematostella vectensis]|eukprot:XP_001640308.1 predicted protein [Nematostella vectensis]